MHWAYIVELRGLFCVSRAFLLCCSNDVERVHSGTNQKQCDRNERHFQEAHFLPRDSQRFPAHLVTDDQEERAIVSAKGAKYDSQGQASSEARRVAPRSQSS